MEPSKRSLGRSLAWALLALAACHKPPLPPAPTRVAPPTFGTFELISEPVGANVVIDGKPRGVTPGRFQVTADDPHELRIELGGYKPAHVRQSLDQDEERSLRFVLDPATPPPR